MVTLLNRGRHHGSGWGKSPPTGRHWPIFSNLPLLLRWFYGLRI